MSQEPSPTLKPPITHTAPGAFAGGPSVIEVEKPPLEAPKEPGREKDAPNSRSDADIRESVRRIRHELKLLQADDIAEIGKYHRVYGFSIIETAVSYMSLLAFNLRRYIRFLFDTWSAFFWGILTGRLDFGEAFSVFFFSAGASATLALIFLWCTFATMPMMIFLYGIFIGHRTNHLSLVNASNSHIFECLTPEQAYVAKRKLAAAADPAAHNPRTFDLDIAKFLLQLSALMYERDIKPMRRAIAHAKAECKPSGENNAVADSEKRTGTVVPGAIIDSLLSALDASKIIDLLDADQGEGERPIHVFSRSHGICFATASELRTSSQAYCSVFWDPRSTWVLVAFKGTDPTSFDEWTTDFTATFEDCSSDIPGFRFVHKGFKDRILPVGGRQPYKSISAAVQIVCNELVKGRDPGTKINVWFTGHSLGTAIASLAYAKALIGGDLGEHAILRDAYLFATPIVCDVDSRLVFNEAMKADPNIPRTLWRVTNRNDFVATGLPAVGDDRLVGLGEDNLFNFSHLGIEIFMKDGPAPSQVTGDAVRQPEGFDVHVASAFDDYEIEKQVAELVSKGYVQPQWIGWIQYLPIVGRLAAHATTNYWEQLQRIALMPFVLKSE